MSFGVSFVVSFRKVKSSAKIVFGRPSLPIFERRRLERDLFLLVAHLDAQRLVGLADAAELIDEVHVPGATAELAVGRGLQPDVLLHLHDLADGVVLDRVELGGSDAARGRVVSSVQH